MKESATQQRIRKYKQDYKFELIEDLGMKYPTSTSKRPQRYGLFKCHCGNTFEVISKLLNRYKNCGCDKSITHGFSNHILYDRWCGMIDRTTNKKHKAYKNYGGRGIVVCDRWKDVANFIEDMYPTYSEGLTIDRIDNDGNYEPSNCKWATREEQSLNKRKQKDTHSIYRGLTFVKDRNNWNVRVKSKHIGTFKDELDAAKAYDKYIVDNKLEYPLNGVL
jgi:hypothetical protein